MAWRLASKRECSEPVNSEAADGLTPSFGSCTGSLEVSHRATPGSKGEDTTLPPNGGVGRNL